MAETSVGSITYDLNLDDDKFKKGMNSASKDVDGLAGKFKNAEADSQQFAAGIAAIGAAAAAFAVVSVKAFNDSEKELAQLDAVLKSTKNAAGLTKDEIVNLASSLQQTTTFSDEAVLSAENLLLTFTNIGKKVFPEATQTVLDMSIALGQDTKASAIQLGKALQDPIQGINALRRVGVNFTDKQKDVIEKLVNTGKVLEAQKLILKELNVEFGGSATNAAKTFAGQIEILKNNFNDFQELIGQAITNRMKPLITAFNEWMTAMGGPQGMMIEFTHVLSQVAQWIPTIAGAITGGLLPAFVALAAAIVTSPLIGFIAVGAAVGYAIQLLNDKFLLVSNSFPILIGLVSSFAVLIMTVLIPAFTAWWTSAGAAALATTAATWPVIALAAAIGALVAAIIWCVQQYLILNDANYAAAMATKNMQKAQEDLTFANQVLANAEDNTTNALHRLESANLAVERAQIALTEAVKAHGPKSIEAREAANRLELAQDGVKFATDSVSEATKKEMEAQTEAIKKNKELVEASKPVKSAFLDIAGAIGNAINKLLEWIGVKDKSGKGGGMSFAEGGWVPYTGTALVHAGEYVLSKDMLANLDTSLADVVGNGKGTVSNSTNNNNQNINIYIDKVGDQQDITQIGRELGFRANLAI